MPGSLVASLSVVVLSSGVQAPAMQRPAEHGVASASGAHAPSCSGCCKQPAGNTLASTRSPFAGVVVAMVDVPAGSSLDALIGPSRGGLHGRFAIGGCPPGVDAKVSLGLLWRTLRPLLGNLLGGRSLPSPFVTADGAVVSPSRVISREERAALYGG